MVVPESFLLKCLEECRNKLDELEISSTTPPCSTDEIRKQTLLVQTSCLSREVEKWNNDEERSNYLGFKLTSEQVQQELRIQQEKAGSAIQREANRLNEAARRAYCRLVLRAEYLREAQDKHENLRELQSSGTIRREDLLEFCGLCQAALHLPTLEPHLREGIPLFHDLLEETNALSAPTRLENIQKRYLRSLGYDPEFAIAEVKRMFFSTNARNNPYANDPDVLDAVMQLTMAVKTALENVMSNTTLDLTLSDHSEGGVTRVVAVNFSETLIDARTGRQVSSDDQRLEAPAGEVMDQVAEDEQRDTLKVAREAAVLQTSILDELRGLSENEREKQLRQAKEVSETFVKKALELPVGPERVMFLRSVDPTTQRLMLMHKLWQG